MKQSHHFCGFCLLTQHLQLINKVAIFLAMCEYLTAKTNQCYKEALPLSVDGNMLQCSSYSSKRLKVNDFTEAFFPNLANHTLHRERKGLVILQLLSC